MNENFKTDTIQEKHDVQKKAPAKRRIWLAVLLVLLVTGVLLLPLLRKPKPAATMGGPGGPGRPPGGMGAATMVSTAKVVVEPMKVYLDALGTVTPEHTASIYSQVSGRVLSVNYREGQMVKEGQSLIEIDPRPYEAQLEQVQGTLARDRAVLEQAQVDLKRYQDALEKNAIAQQTVFDQQAAVKQYQGSIQNDEGSLKYDQVQLSYCHIFAPFAGRIGLRLVDPGNTIFAGSSNTLAVITQLDPITVVFSLAEDNVQILQKQMRGGGALKVDLFDRAQANKITSGTLLTLDNQVDTTTGTFKLRAMFHNPHGSLLFPNQFVNVRLQVKTIPDAHQIPTVAIQYNGQQGFVYVVQPDSTVTLRNVTVTNAGETQSAVDGLDPGTTVVTNNFDRLQDGAKVMTAPTGPPASRGGKRP